MNIVENLLEVIDEVLDEKEKEVILSFLDSADEIDFDDFWRNKNYTVVAEKGLTSYSWTRDWPKGHRPVTNFTVYYRIKSAMEKLEKSPKLRAICVTYLQQGGLK